MSYESDERAGRYGLGGNRNSEGWINGNNGRIQAEADAAHKKAEALSAANRASTTSMFPTHNFSAGTTSTNRETTRTERVQGTPATLISCARHAGTLAAILYALYCLSLPLSWPEIAVQVVFAGLAGALAGAALYVAVKVAIALLKVAGMLLMLGIGLHLLGLINLGSVLSRLAHTAGM